MLEGVELHDSHGGVHEDDAKVYKMHQMAQEEYLVNAKLTDIQKQFNRWARLDMLDLAAEQPTWRY